MTQQEMAEFFEAHPDSWYSVSDISDKTGISKGSISMSLHRMRKYNEVEFREEKRRNLHSPTFFYKAVNR